jgi:RHS repeat-associated protein
VGPTDSRNLLIEGDNLLALKALLPCYPGALSGGTPMAMRTGTGDPNYLLGDHPSTSLRTGLGSTSITANSSGAFVSEVRYLPFGQDRYTSGTTPTTYRFTGQRQEVGLGGPGGLYFYNARWYDSLVGRFASADTIVPGAGNPQNLNRYSYSLSNPLKYTDPSGHDPIDALAFLAGILYGWGHANLVALGPIVPQAAMQEYDALAVDSDAFVAGRVVGGIATVAQGVGETGAGLGAMGGGGLLCTTGVGCVIGGGEAVVAGGLLTTHGATAALAGAAEAGYQANILFAKINPPKHGPKPGPHPELPPGVKNTNELGQALNRGTGEEALNAMTPVTVQAARNIGMTPQNAQQWAAWYAAHARWNPEGNLSAAPRVQLMRYIAEMLIE